MNNQNIKVKRTKDDIRLYNNIYYLHVRRYDEKYKEYMKQYLYEYRSNNSRTRVNKL